MRRVRKLAYMKKLPPSSAGDLPEIPDWGGKLRIQAEMEVTKCIASAILFHKMREMDRVRTSDLTAGTSAPSNISINIHQDSPAPTGKILSNAQEYGKTRQVSKDRRQRLANKSDAEVNLINQMWADPALQGIPQASPPGTRGRSRSQSPLQSTEDGRADDRVSKDLNNYLEREYVRDVASARQFIQQNYDELFTASRAAALGGAGSLAVLLQTLQTQVSMLASRNRSRRAHSKSREMQRNGSRIYVLFKFDERMPCRAGGTRHIGGCKFSFPAAQQSPFRFKPSHTGRRSREDFERWR